MFNEEVSYRVDEYLFTSKYNDRAEIDLNYLYGKEFVDLIDERIESGNYDFTFLKELRDIYNEKLQEAVSTILKKEFTQDEASFLKDIHSWMDYDLSNQSINDIRYIKEHGVLNEVYYNHAPSDFASDTFENYDGSLFNGNETPYNAIDSEIESVYLELNEKFMDLVEKEVEKIKNEIKNKPLFEITDKEDLKIFKEYLEKNNLDFEDYEEFIDTSSIRKIRKKDD